MRSLNILLLFPIFFISFNGMPSNKKLSCERCEIAGDLFEKVLEAQKVFLEKEEDLKKHGVVFGPTQERKAFELVQGEVFNFVCDLNKPTFNEQEKKAIMNLVLDINQLQITSSMLSEMNICFRTKVVKLYQDYRAIAKDEGREDELIKLIQENRSTAQDVAKKKK